MNNPTEQLQLADAAITHVLRRIHESPEVGYYMGVCTESFERLAAAYGALHDKPADAVKENFLPILAQDPCKELQERIEQLERSQSGRHYVPDDDPPTFGPQNLTPDDFVDQVKLLLGEYHGDSERCVQAISALLDITDVPYPILARRS
jgi:hypothetical protein